MTTVSELLARLFELKRMANRTGHVLTRQQVNNARQTLNALWNKIHRLPESIVKRGRKNQARRYELFIERQANLRNALNLNTRVVMSEASRVSNNSNNSRMSNNSSSRLRSMSLN
jgi:hypothetical protein